MLNLYLNQNFTVNLFQLIIIALQTVKKKRIDIKHNNAILYTIKKS